MRQRALIALSFIALLLFAKPLLKNEVLTLRDHSDYFQPLRLFTNQELRRGHLPLWNPYNASGEPWLANPQTGVFYPPAWIFIVVPFAPAYALFLAAHVALLGCGAFLLFRRIADPPAAFAGALALMLCGPALSLLDVSNTLTTFAWIPLVLWCAVSMASPRLSAVVIAMSFLGGEPFFAAVGALLFAMLRRRNLLDIAATSFALTSIQLLPFLAQLRGSDRAGSVTAKEILRDSMPLSDWVHVFFGGASRQHFIPVVYCGVSVTVLAILAIATAWRRRAVWLASALLLGSAIGAAGAYVAPVAYVLTHLPIDVLRYPARMLPLGAIAIAALAAIGCQALVRHRWMPYAIAALVIVDLTPHIAPLFLSAPFNPHPTPYDTRMARDSKIARLTSGEMLDRAAWINGYLNLFDRRFDLWTAAPVVSEEYAKAYVASLGKPALLDAMSAGYLLSDRPLRLPAIAHSGTVTMYRNPAALPLAYWRGSDGRIAPPALLAFTTTAVHITVDAPADGVVVVTQQNASGWNVTVDDASAQPLREGFFRAVRVKSGRHAIAWRYRPPSLVAGAVLTLLGILRMMLSKFFVKRSREKIFFSNALASA